MKSYRGDVWRCDRANQIELNGLTFQYCETGEPSLLLIVALHAIGTSAETWDQVVLY